MTSEWRITTIGKEATLQRGFDITRKEQRLGFVPVISSSGITSYHDTAIVKKPGVVIGRKGCLGTVFYVEDDYWPHDTTLWVKDFHGNFPKFIYYLFKSLDVMHLDVGSANPTLNRNHVHPIEIKLPPLLEQKAIARILSSLDDKIELNREMNKTLEAITQAIFKSWFVDFDPVRAKMEGRQPAGMDAATAELFPDAFEESTLGLIPKGWCVRKLGNLARNVSKTFDFSAKSKVIFINTGDVLLGYFLHSNRISTEGLPGQAKKSINYNDILMSEIRPANGRYAYVDFDSSEYVVSTKFMIISASDHIEPRLLYRILTLEKTLAEFQVIAESRSGTFPQITFDSISYFPIILPPKTIQLEFLRVVDLLDKQIKINHLQSNTLASIRDTLLPKLLSGEIRVQEADKIVEEVM